MATNKDSYNGILGNINARLDEHSRRLDVLEEYYAEDHDELLTLKGEVSWVKNMLDEHIKYHNKLSERHFTIKHGIYIAIIQSLLIFLSTLLANHI